MGSYAFKYIQGHLKKKCEKKLQQQSMKRLKNFKI